MIADVLAEAAHPHLRRIWSEKHNMELERELWIQVMLSQRFLGLDIPAEAIAASMTARPVDHVTVSRAHLRERTTRHDLKARLEVFCEDAGHEYHHLGMTSADIVDNVAQIKIRQSLLWLEDERDLGLGALIGRYAMRGIKGAIGTQQDQLALLGSAEACDLLDQGVATWFGFRDVLRSVGQTYPRSQDLEVCTELTSAAARATTDDRRPLLALLSGFGSMLAAVSGDQWNEGDVSSSVVRRVALPGMVYATELITRD